MSKKLVGSAVKFRTFREFWPFYVLEHSKPGTRALHFVGTTLLFIFLTAILTTSSAWYLLFGIISAYGCAWTGHFFIEKNRPATFKYPLFSLAGDFKMYALMVAGKMNQEVELCKSLSLSADPSASSGSPSH